jgi:hypothetical protein
VSAVAVPRVQGSKVPTPDESILAKLVFGPSGRKPHLAVLLKDQRQVPQLISRLADELGETPQAERVLRVLRKTHTLSSALATVSAEWFHNRGEAVSVVEALCRIFGKDEVDACLKKMHMYHVIDYLNT